MKVNITKRKEAAERIVQILKGGDEYTYNDLRRELKNLYSVGLISSIVSNQCGKRVKYRTEVTGNEPWQQRTYISLSQINSTAH